MNVKPAVGFTLPSAGVTPAPSEKYKSQNGEDATLLSGSWESAAPILYTRLFPFRLGNEVTLKIRFPRVILERGEESRFFFFASPLRKKRPDSPAAPQPLDDLKTYLFQVRER